MADLSELLKSKKVSEFVRQGKSRPWTVDRAPPEPNTGTFNPVTTEAQPGHNPVTNTVTTEAQPGHNPGTQNLQKTPEKRNPVTTRSPTRSRFETNPVTTEAQPGQKIRDYKTLVGNDRNVMLTLFLDARQQGSTETSMFSRAALAARLGLSYEAIRSSIKRLVRFGILEKVESSKGGPGSWVLVRFSQSVFQRINLTEAQPGHNPVTNPVTTEAQPGHQPGHAVSSSSSLIDLHQNLKTTTTSEPELFESTATQLAPEWRPIDCAPLSGIGFTQTHLVQIIRQGKLTPEEVQDSIHFFAFDLARNEKGKGINGNPLNFFMGIIRKGAPYAPPENYESPADEARRKTREFKQRKECERQADEQQLLNLEFAEWRRGLSESELLKLLPDFARKAGPIQDSALKVHFENEVWPERAQDLLGLEKLDRAEISKQLDQTLGQGSTA